MLQDCNASIFLCVHPAHHNTVIYEAKASAQWNLDYCRRRKRLATQEKKLITLCLSTPYLTMSTVVPRKAAKLTTARSAAPGVRLPRECFNLVADSEAVWGKVWRALGKVIRRILLTVTVPDPHLQYTVRETPSSSQKTICGHIPCKRA